MRVYERRVWVSFYLLLFLLYVSYGVFSRFLSLCSLQQQQQLSFNCNQSFRYTHTLDTHSQLAVCVILFFSLLCSDDDTHMLTLTHMMRTITCIDADTLTHTHAHISNASTQNTTEQAICVWLPLSFSISRTFFFSFSALLFVSFVLLLTLTAVFLRRFLSYGVRICKNI